jgi:uncharacterized protein YgiM (DUF1202 family)
MTGMTMINDAALETIVGGAVRTVKNTSVGYAFVRIQPGLKSRVLGKISNGRKVNTTGRRIFNEDDDRYFSEVRVNGQKGWIASSIIGD